MRAPRPEQRGGYQRLFESTHIAAMRSMGGAVGSQREARLNVSAKPYQLE